MTQVKDIYDFLCEEAPLELQMSFDNSGVQIGRLSKQVSKVILALDVTDYVLEEALECGAELIISHHPLLFKGCKVFNLSRLYTGKLPLIISVGKYHL